MQWRIHLDGECVVPGGKKSNWGECMRFSEHEMGVVRFPPTPLNLAHAEAKQQVTSVPK